MSRMNKKSVAFFNSNDIYPVSADSTLPFEQHRDIFYLSGVDQEESVLMLCPDASDPKHREVLFLKETDEHIAVWEGPKLNKKQAYETSGIKTVYWTDEMEKVIDEISNDLNIKEFLEIKTGELSSGQKNRVTLAKSLINNPEILFLDEPTASLDPDTGDYVRSYLENYKEKNKLTMLLASHNMNEVERLCDTIIMMKKGKIIDEGTCEQIIKKHGRENLEQTFLKLARSKDEN